MVQTHDPWQWMFVAAALGSAAGLASYAHALGAGKGLVPRLSDGVERMTGLPDWAAATLIAGLWALAVAVIGFEWDVAWHADNGRDKELLTVPHTLILLGLGGLAVAAGLSVWLSRRRGRGIPKATPALALLALGALAGFPLDDFWHIKYGIDVTMWSPTHLLMIGAASLATIALWELLAEAHLGQARRSLRWATYGGTALVGLSTFQLEYDMGIPQWQLIFQPILIAAAAGIILVAARVAIGRGGALLSALVFIAIRGFLLILIGPVLGHAWPRFPLYLGEAAVVEAVFWLGGNRLRPWQAALACGLGIGTIGLLIEAAWIGLWYTDPWTPALLPYMWQPLVAALAAAPAGLALGRSLVGARSAFPAAVPALGLAVIAALLGYHVLARHAEPATFAVALTQAGTVEVSVTPATAAANADELDATAWQGHAPLVHRHLVEVAPGRFRSDGPLPSGDGWKSIVVIGRGDMLDAAPVSLPADFETKAPAVTPSTGSPREEPAVGTPQLLMREFHGGRDPFAVSVFAIFLGFVLAWLVSLGLGAAALSPRRRPRSAASRFALP